MTDSRIDLVRAGYDAISDEYLDWTTRIEGDPKERYVRDLLERLQHGARVLELGCGAGEPCTRILAERFDVTGVDLSAEQLRRARSNVPAATFVQGDLATIELEPGSFAAAVAVYVLNHVPRELLGDVLARIRSWLVPGGLFLASFGTGDTDGWTGRWLGTTMFFSSFEPATNRGLLREAGFELVVDDLVRIVEPEPDGAAIFQWVLARR